MAPPPPYINGHSNESGPEVPPKVDRTSKPGRVRSGQDFGSGKELDYDGNYINTGRGASVEPQHKVSTAHQPVGRWFSLPLHWFKWFM